MNPYVEALRPMIQEIHRIIANRGDDYYLYGLKRRVARRVSAAVNLPCEAVNGWQNCTPGKRAGKVKLIIDGKPCEFNFKVEDNNEVELYQAFLCPSCGQVSRTVGALQRHVSKCIKAAAPPPTPLEKRAKITISSIEDVKGSEEDQVANWLEQSGLLHLRPKLVEEGFTKLEHFRSLKEISAIEIKDLLGIDGATSVRLLSSVRCKFI